ncbi:uncharacterized protein LOC110436986 [Sorghum bicolor]|uniref:uncharacterized protein LOC110436986 n=1 Tax=Sorghum bicolor TaxID=4558 RepID=UPI000B425673|nr:uncharacterized protein LOC110436986 [Sorghum bicolor]|eukprot:XP_021320579.1 uncharacterized protein LOC110436986 [Sorghum bicolor]
MQLLRLEDSSRNWTFSYWGVMQAGSSSGFARDAVAETGERPTSISFSQMSRNQVTASMGHHIWGDCIHIHRHSSTRSVAASHGKQERGRHRSRSLKCPEIKLQQAWGIISGEIAFTFTATHLQDLSQPAMFRVQKLILLGGSPASIGTLAGIWRRATVNILAGRG